MRFAVDTVDESGNDRLYIGTPVEVREDKLHLKLRDGEVKLDVAKIVDWFPIDLSKSGERVELFRR